MKGGVYRMLTLEAFAKASREHIIQDFSVKAYTDGFATLFRSIKKA